MAPEDHKGHADRTNGPTRRKGSFDSFRATQLRVGPRLRLGIGFYHASNGGLGENNPGTEVLEVVLGFPFGTTSE